MSLFGEAKGERERPELALRAGGETGRALSKGQKRFNTLVRRIERVRAEIVAEQSRLEWVMAEYVREVAPVEAAVRRERRRLLDLLAGAWRAPKGLGKGQRGALLEVVRNLLIEVVEDGAGEADEALVRLGEEIAQATVAEEKAARTRGGGEGEEGTSADAADEEPDLDMERFHPGMSPDEIMAELCRQLEGAGETEADTHTPEGKSTRREGAAERRRREREAAEAEARRVSIGAVYKQLAKALHPDLERDPERQAEKLALMQRVTEAYRAGDLLTLLQIELEFVHGEEDRLAELSEEKLKIYCEALAEQLENLERERWQVAAQARFSVVQPYLSPLGARGWRTAEITSHLEAVRRSLTETADGLAGVAAKETLRDLLRHHRAEVKRARRLRW